MYRLFGIFLVAGLVTVVARFFMLAHSVGLALETYTPSSVDLAYGVLAITSVVFTFVLTSAKAVDEYLVRDGGEAMRWAQWRAVQALAYIGMGIGILLGADAILYGEQSLTLESFHGALLIACEVASFVVILVPAYSLKQIYTTYKHGLRMLKGRRRYLEITTQDGKC
jgi:hypothetical protein